MSPNIIWFFNWVDDVNWLLVRKHKKLLKGIPDVNRYKLNSSVCLVSLQFIVAFRFRPYCIHISLRSHFPLTILNYQSQHAMRGRHQDEARYVILLTLMFLWRNLLSIPRRLYIMLWACQIFTLEIFLISSLEKLTFGIVFNWKSKIILNCFDFALVRRVIGPEQSSRFRWQPDSKQKPFFPR